MKYQGFKYIKTDRSYILQSNYRQKAKSFSILILLCLFPYLVNSQNYYKNSPEVYYNMDKVPNNLTDTIHLPVMEVINPDLLSKIEKCVKNYEKKVITTPDSLGSYFFIDINNLNYMGLSISPYANFYLSYVYDDFKALNQGLKELSIDQQYLYYGCFYYKNYLFIINTNNQVDDFIFPKLFTNSNKYVDIKIYKTPYLGRYGDTDNYYSTQYNYKIKTKKKGKIYFEPDNAYAE